MLQDRLQGAFGPWRLPGAAQDANAARALAEAFGPKHLPSSDLLRAPPRASRNPEQPASLHRFQILLTAHRPIY